CWYRNLVGDFKEIVAKLELKENITEISTEDLLALELSEQGDLWREAFSLVKEGVCSAEDVDIAITSGPGLRWALFGPYINMELANQKGFKEAIHHLGPPMTEWWNDMQNFQHSEETTELLEEQTKELLTHYKDIDLSQKRDKGLVDILKLRQQLELD
ncbi:3-hydroxyacyl-CoA dehydrogenase family protein, partial [Acinetobacter baumannii]|uniref:3-hydroxyacyl-CoA dehydrogenase family protein n=1 Tax=Acinetobacter baumannii TaxID=470 RepID=UPI0021D4DC6D